MKIQQTIRFITLLLTGLYAGSAMYSLMGVSPAMNLMSPAAYAEFHQKLDLFMGVRMAMFAKIALVFNVLLLILTIRKSSRPLLWLTIIGFLFFFAEIFFTVSVNVPLNKNIQGWTITSLPQQWESIRDKWVRFDTIRSIFAISSFILYLSAYRISTRK